MLFDSVLFDENELISKEKLITLKEVLQSEYCTIRYQYVKPSQIRLEEVISLKLI